MNGLTESGWFTMKDISFRIFQIFSSAKDSTSTNHMSSGSEIDRFTKELEEITLTEEVTEIFDVLIPYNLQTQHSLPDKSIADVVESLIGCYLTMCSQRAALMFMSWLGLNVLPEPALEIAKKRTRKHKRDGQKKLVRL